MEQIRNLKEFKNTKHHTILLKVLNDAILSNFKYEEYSNIITIETEKYCFSAYLYRTNYGIMGSITSTIKRKDNNTSRSADYGVNVEIANYLKELYFSEKFAFGQWLKSSELDWDKIEGI